MKRWFAALALALTASAALWAQTPNRTGASRYEAALQKEVEGADVLGAIAIYEDIVTHFADDKALMAKTLWRLGRCYERRGDPRARPTYEKLTQQFGEFTTYTSQARARLATMVDAPVDIETNEVLVDATRDRSKEMIPSLYPQPGVSAMNPNGEVNRNVVIFSDLAVHDTRNGESRRLTSGARSAAYPVVSSTNEVAYFSWSGDLQENLRLMRANQAIVRPSAELRVVSVNGTLDRLIYRNDTVPWLRPFAWSPDNKQIATVLEDIEGSRQIALIDAANGSMRSLRKLDAVSPQAMAFSPDGQYLTYELPTPRNSGELDFVVIPIAAGARTVRRYSITADTQRPATAAPDQAIIHVLNRTGFGPRLGDIEKVKAMGIDAYIDLQLHPERIADPVVDAKLANLTSLKMTLPELLESAGPPVLEGLRRRATLVEMREMADRKMQAKLGSQVLPPPATEPPGTAYANRPGDIEVFTAKLIRAVYSERQLQEVMVDFWMNHFNVTLKDDIIAPDYENTIRRHVFGKFEDLLLAVAKHPKMLYYLDNWLSSAPADVLKQRIAAVKANGTADERVLLKDRQPFLEKSKGLNENYGRELLELHTVGVTAGYTQQDIIAAAKVLTGWTISGRGIINGREDDGAFWFDPMMHVDGDKVVMGQTFKSGGVEEGEQLLKMLAHRPETARFIATKLVRRFIADNPPEPAIDAASRTFLQTGGDIREVLRTILTSPQFRSSTAYGGKIKKPLELVASSLRAVNADVEFLTADDNGYGTFLGNRGTLAQMGEKIYNYEAPDGNPDVGPAWINSNALMVRLDFANRLATGKYRGIKVSVDSARLLFDQLGLPKPTPAQVEQTRTMLQKQATDASASAPYEQKMMMAPGGAAAARGVPPVDQVAAVVATMLGSPQFQKR